MRRLFLALIILFLHSHGQAQNNDFYILLNGGFQPYTTATFQDKANSTSYTHTSVGVLLGVQPNYKINEFTTLSLFYVLEGHDQPVPTSSVIGIKGHYFFKGQPTSPFINLGIGNGLNGNGNNSIYLNGDFGYQFLNKKRRVNRVALGYSLAKATDYNYSETGALPAIETDAITQAFSLVFSTNTFMGKQERRRDRRRP